MINEAYEMVKEFQRAAGQPVSNVPIVLSKERVSIRSKWMAEELNEFISASDVYLQADALTDLLYYLLGTFVELGVKPDDIFDIVHKANLMKLKKPSEVIKGEDGKVLKPLNWNHPDIEIKEAIDMS